MAVMSAVRYIPISYEITVRDRYKTHVASKYSDSRSFKVFQTYIGHVMKLIEQDLKSHDIKYDILGLSIDFKEHVVRFAYDLTGDALTIRELGFISM